MATIAYIDHPFHQKTQSTHFLPELLERQGHEVRVLYHDGDKSAGADCWNKAKECDAVILFQHYPDIGLRRFASAHPNVTYIPMLDQFGQWSPERRSLGLFWEPFRGCKILNFSRTLHDITEADGLATRCFTYYPNADPQVAGSRAKGLRGFFWLRRDNQLPWGTIRQLLGNTVFDSFHLHIAPDPGFPDPALPDEDDIQRFNITTSSWLPDKSQFRELLEGANVYFAPRREEGIGLSFLEAMAMGQCVVAADRPTMNEYVEHGVNGLLYNPDSPRPLDFTEAQKQGNNALQKVVAGRSAWLADNDDLVDFILTPPRASAARAGNSVRLAAWFIGSRARLAARKILRSS
jgi:hypothetical protein